MRGITVSYHCTPPARVREGVEEAGVMRSSEVEWRNEQPVD